MDHLADAPIANILILAGVIFLAVGLFGRIGGFIGTVFGNIEAAQNSRVLAGVLGVLLIVGGAWMHEDSHKSAASTSAPAAPLTTASVTPTVSPAPSAAPTTTVTPPTTTPATGAPIATPGAAANRPVAANAARDAKPAAPAPRPAPNTQLTTSVAPSIPMPAAARENLPAPTPAPVFDDRLVGTWTNLTPRSDSIRRIEFARVGHSLDAHVWYNCPPTDCDVGTFPVTISGTAPVFEYNGNGRRRVGTLNLHTSKVLLLSMDISTPGTGSHFQNHWVMVKSTLPEEKRDAFRGYFGASEHKAFAISPNGSWAYQYRAGSVDHAIDGALRRCQEKGGVDCRVILVEDDAR
jgi:hypothetical protein